MRIYLRREVVAIRRRLSERNRAELFSRLEMLLKTDQAPEWTIEAHSKPGSREFFLGGYWFIYRVDRSAGEPAIIVAAVEEN